MDEWLTTAEAAAQLGVKPQTLYAYVSRDLIRRERLPGSRTSRYSPRSVRLRIAPAGQALSHRIEERDPGRRIGGDYRVADARESNPEELLFAVQNGIRVRKLCRALLHCALRIVVCTPQRPLRVLARTDIA